MAHALSNTPENTTFWYSWPTFMILLPKLASLSIKSRGRNNTPAACLLCLVHLNIHQFSSIFFRDAKHFQLIISSSFIVKAQQLSRLLPAFRIAYRRHPPPAEPRHFIPPHQRHVPSHRRHGGIPSRPARHAWHAARKRLVSAGSRPQNAAAAAAGSTTDRPASDDRHTARRHRRPSATWASRWQQGEGPVP